jgi:hypothetical protein
LSKKNDIVPDEFPTGGPIRPARKVVHRSPHRSVGILACSWIQDHGIEYESQLERRFLQQALVLPMVKRVIHQPFRLEYLEDGKTHNYVPDFLLLLADGIKVVIEVKPRKFLNAHRHKLVEAQRILAEKKVPFLVMTDQEIDDGIKVQNASYLLRFARGSASEEAKQHCLKRLRESPNGLRLDELIQETGVPEKDILHFAGRTTLWLDLSEPITNATTIHIPKEDQNDYLHFINWFNTAPGHAISGISENAQ